MPRATTPKEEVENSTTEQQLEQVQANSASKGEETAKGDAAKTVEVPAGTTMVAVTGENGAATATVVASAPAVVEAAAASKEVQVKVLRNHTLYLVGKGNIDLKTGQVLSVGMDVAQTLSLRQIAVLIG